MLSLHAPPPTISTVESMRTTSGLVVHDSTQSLLQVPTAAAAAFAECLYDTTWDWDSLDLRCLSVCLSVRSFVRSSVVRCSKGCVTLTKLPATAESEREKQMEPNTKLQMLRQVFSSLLASIILSVSFTIDIAPGEALPWPCRFPSSMLCTTLPVWLTDWKCIHFGGLPLYWNSFLSLLQSMPCMHRIFWIICIRKQWIIDTYIGRMRR